MTDELNSLDPYIQLTAAEARRPVHIDPAARERLMEAIRREPVPRRELRALAWATTSRPVWLSPLASALAAAGLIGIGVLGGHALNRDGRVPAEQPQAVVVGNPQLPDSLKPHAVKFVLVAPAASRVSVVGDFNQWDPAATPLTVQNRNGEWTAFVPLQPGLHVYSFVVDGEYFVADPTAPRAPDDGYGHRSSVVLVGES